ncbi:hypothetical protein AC578_7543 [Pseudocercospora eumusae]|uniref:Uncharacterized protein n=1 Tax=Pseudocercospora eumusae TaxID=321146 RepID=A0A139HRP3_9PEZI|nr:hypothetical protein AC578_7543 [Pseudocercospora eumusae]
MKQPNGLCAHTVTRKVKARQETVQAHTRARATAIILCRSICHKPTRAVNTVPLRLPELRKMRRNHLPPPYAALPTCNLPHRVRELLRRANLRLLPQP